MAYEEAPYNVVHSTDTYEIRHYKDRLVVEVVNKNDDNSFRKLFRYISGQNNKSEEIKMTVPVTQGEKDEGYYMQFYLPSKFTRNNAPLPNNPDIKISTIKEGYFAVIQYSGRASDKNFFKHRDILNQKLIEDNININDEYDPPEPLSDGSQWKDNCGICIRSDILGDNHHQPNSTCSKDCSFSSSNYRVT